MALLEQVRGLSPKSLRLVRRIMQTIAEEETREGLL